MFDYFEKHGLESAKPTVYPEVSEDLLEGARKLLAAVESMTDAQVDGILGDIQKDFISWINSDRDNYYSALEAENRVFGLESAYIQDRSVFKTALIRLRMALALGKESSATTSYISVIKDVDTSRLKQGDSNVVLSKQNIDAYFDIMKLVQGVSYVDNKEMNTIVRGISSKIDKRISKVFLSYIGGSVAMGTSATLGVGGLLLGLLMYAYTGIQLNGMTKDNESNAEAYGDLFKKNISKVFEKSGFAAKVGAKLNSSGTYDSSELIKIVNAINSSRQHLLPVQIRSQVSRPDFRKTKQVITYQEKVAVVEKLKEDGQSIINALGNTPAKLNHAIGYTLSFESMNFNQESITYGGVPSENALYGSLCQNLVATITDTLTASCLLVVDLKKY